MSLYITEEYTEEFFKANPDHEGVVIYTDIVSHHGYKFMEFNNDTSEINAVWLKSSYKHNSETDMMVMVPDNWEMEDLRQGEVMFVLMNPEFVMNKL